VRLPDDAVTVVSGGFPTGSLKLKFALVSLVPAAMLSDVGLSVPIGWSFVKVTDVAPPASTALPYASYCVTNDVNVPPLPTITNPAAHDWLEFVYTNLVAVPAVTVTLAAPLRVPSVAWSETVSAATSVMFAVPTPFVKFMVAGYVGVLPPELLLGPENVMAWLPV
jgi:hypothetical protein